MSGKCRTQAGEDGEEQPEFLPMFPWYSGKSAYPLTLRGITDETQVDNVDPWLAHDALVNMTHALWLSHMSANGASVQVVACCRYLC